ncbi:MAG: PrsW family intramembrane metalloprotease [Micrococcales bacterium]|nr:MAG: PrsW family intramembrane metalloprotease [Micrococcales bacterium]
MLARTSDARPPTMGGVISGDNMWAMPAAHYQHHNQWARAVPNRPWPGPVQHIHTVPRQTYHGPPVPAAPGHRGAVDGPAAYQPRRRVRHPLVWAFFAVLFFLSGFVALLITGFEVGLTGTLVGAVLAVLPLPVVLGAFLWLDRYENEPVPLLVLAFGWGATVAMLVSLVLNTAGALVIMAGGGTPESTAVLVAPVVEELTKGAGVLVVLAILRDRFDGVVDGLVYAGFVAAGFAYVENILYFGRALQEAGGPGLTLVFLLRGVVSPFAHPMFTAAAGIGIGVAVSNRSTLIRVFAPLGGVAVAIALHALWNATAAFGGGLVFVLNVPVFVLFVVLVVYMRRREGFIIRRNLSTYAHFGWLSSPDVRMLDGWNAAPPATTRPPSNTAC